MANLPSSKKNIRKSLRRRKKNKNILEKIKETLQKAKGLTPEIQKLIDKAAKEKVIHKNKASHLKYLLVARKGKK